MPTSTTKAKGHNLMKSTLNTLRSSIGRVLARKPACEQIKKAESSKRKSKFEMPLASSESKSKPGFKSRLKFAHGISLLVAASVLTGVGFTTSTWAAFSVGDRIVANSTVNVRSTPGGTAVGQHFSNDRGTIAGGPTNATYNGTSYTWYKVTWDTAPTSGWSIQDGVTGGPTLTSPSTVVGANVAQTVTFNGANIPSGSMVKLRLGTTIYTISSANTTWLSSSQIQITA